MLVLFGTAYPHFLATGSWTEYAYAAPLGLIPCPTLAVVIGFTLMFRNLGITAWKVLLIIAGLLYGLIGVFGLGVLLDVALLAGTLVLTIVAIAGDGRRSVRANREGLALGGCRRNSDAGRRSGNVRMPCAGAIKRCTEEAGKGWTRFQRC